MNAVASIVEELSPEGGDPPAPEWRATSEHHVKVALTFLDQIDRSELATVLPKELVHRFFDSLEVHRALAKSLQQALGWIDGVREGVVSPLASELAPLLAWLAEHPLSGVETKKMISQKILDKLARVKQWITAQAKAANTDRTSRIVGPSRRRPRASASALTVNVRLPRNV